MNYVNMLGILYQVCKTVRSSLQTDTETENLHEYLQKLRAKWR